jgi:hypothetical protein
LFSSSDSSHAPPRTLLAVLLALPVIEAKPDLRAHIPVKRGTNKTFYSVLSQRLYQAVNLFNEEELEREEGISQSGQSDTIYTPMYRRRQQVLLNK